MPKKIVLASSSPSRITILEQLGLPFEKKSPDIDETQRPGEKPSAMVQRLAVEKAQAVAPFYPRALIIGSDQVAEINGQVFGKPYTYEKAMEQLMAVSGQIIDFQNGLCVLNSQTGQFQVKLNTVRVHFKSFTAAQADLYCQLDQPYTCAGSIRIEGRGIILIDRIESKDPYSLIGLPLIDLTDFLQAEGVDLLSLIKCA